MGMLLTFKHVSVFLILNDCVRIIYRVNVWGTILVLTLFSRVHLSQILFVLRHWVHGDRLYSWLFF
jgi:hypothetical protein